MAKQLRANIFSLAFGGSGVGKVDGKVCFVDGALPGEEVLFEVLKDTARYIEGAVTEILKPSGDRTPPLCRYYAECGGCQLQHLSYEKELYYKKEQVVQLLNRISGRDDFICQDVVPSRDCYHYRSSVTLHKKGNKYGYYARDGRTIIAIEECLVAEEAINRELIGLTAGSGKDDVTLKADHLGQVWISDRSGERFFADRYRDVEVFLSPKSFSQSNRYISEMVAETLERWIGPSHPDTAFFDAYCGAGFFSFLLGQDFGIRVGMDTNRIAIDCAKTTVKKHGLHNVKFYKGDVEKEFFDVFHRTKKQENILLIDPPRKGADRSFLEKVKAEEDVSGIYYISCDPARLARDVKILTDDSEWALKKVCPFDMFPRTKHIEVLAEFSRE